MKNVFLSIRFACREMRAGLRGFAIFFSCIVLGVAAVASVNGISSMIGAQFDAQGQTILGADIRITMTQGEATQEELAFFKAQGKLASSIWLRSMIRYHGNRRTQISPQLIEIKAIDENYPLYGQFETAPVADFYTLFAPRNGLFGVVLIPELMQRLSVQIGDEVEIGTQIFQIRGQVISEPDLLSEGLQLGLRVFMAQAALENSALLQEGSLNARIYKIAMTDNVGAKVLKSFDEQLKRQFPDRIWNVRSRLNAAPTLKINIKRFLQFLTLIGLTALIVGGTGVAQAVHVYLQGKREVIAIFKTLGASGNFIIMLYLTQIMMIGLMAIATGLVIAAGVPALIKHILQQFLPMSDAGVFYPKSLVIGAVFGLLSILAFALVPLGRARYTHVTSLFRPDNLNERSFTPLTYRILSIILLLLLAGLALLLGNDRRLALIFIVAISGVFLILKLLDMAIEALARRFSHLPFLSLRLAFGNICRPGSLSSAVVRALGLGLTLLVALTTLDGNLRKQLSETGLTQAPTFFFLDVPGNRGEEFRSYVQQYAHSGQVQMMPILRARITNLKGVTAEQAEIDEDGRWVLRGDRNVSFSSTLPEESVLSKGTWWEENYNGPPLVSVSALEAKRLRLNIGDKLTVNVLGRTIEAEIANLREVDWDSMKMNFVLIFSPNSFAGAPYTYLATLTMTPDVQQEVKITNGLSENFPSLTIISTRNILQDARQLADQIGLAVQACALIVLLASILVLAGALSAGNRGRSHSVVILKILGASRKTIIGAFVLEYAILGVLTSVFAFIFGSMAGVYVAKFRMNLSQAALVPESAIFVLLIALLLSVGLGLTGTWRILGQKPARALREL